MCLYYNFNLCIGKVSSYFPVHNIYNKMNNNNNTIYGFDVNLICDFFLIQKARSGKS